MTSLGSLQEEDLDEIYIESSLDTWHSKGNSKWRSRTFNGEAGERQHTSPCLSRRSYSHPEIHFLFDSTLIRPDELRFSTEISRATSDINWSEARPDPEPFSEPCTMFTKHTISQSTLSDIDPHPFRKSRFLTRYDPSTVEERMKSMQSLLSQIYQDELSPNTMKDLPDSMTESFQSDLSHNSPRRLSAEALQVFDRNQLVNEVTTLTMEIERANQRLVRMVRQRSHYRAKQATKCAILSAILMANSSKTSADSKLRFTLEPPLTHDGVEEWKRAMRTMARIRGGLPTLIRCKLWSKLGDLYILSTGMEWDEIRKNAFSEKLQPDDNKIHSQILKDLHRTGWSEFDDEKKLKQVLLAYARYNKEIGYCQGFNVIAALILQVVEYRTDVALKVMIFLIEHVMPRGYFDQSLGALSVDMIVMRDLMLQRLPSTVQHLEALQNSSENEYEPPLPNIFSMHWFLTLFATCLPRECVLRVWDALMLQGSEILLRTAIALWSKMSRKILHTSTADEFYTLMDKLCKELAEMNDEEQDHLMTVIYSMSEFPYPGLAELREKHKWNIQPLSPTFKLFRKSVEDILHDSHSDSNLRSKIDKWSNLRSLEKQYQLTKQRQKQAAVIMNNAYVHGQNSITNQMKYSQSSTPYFPSHPMFNHLVVGPALAQDGSVTKPPTTLTGGAVQLAATVIQPSDNSVRVSRSNAQNSHIALTGRTERNGRPLSSKAEKPRTDKNHEYIPSEEKRPTTPPVYIYAVKSEDQLTTEYREKMRRSRLILQQAAPCPALRHSFRNVVRSTS